MQYTVADAALAIGKSKATVLRAIAKGRISAARDDAGMFHIDPSELHRVFPAIAAAALDAPHATSNVHHEATLRRASSPLKRESNRCKRRRGCATIRSPIFAGASMTKLRSVDG